MSDNPVQDGSSHEDLSYDEFINHVRRALHYLYDPVTLRQSPLVSILNLSDSFDTAAALQEIMIKSIQALKPQADEPPQAASWKIYDTLNLQYIRHFSSEVIASQLGISERQLRRERRLALEALSQHIWKTLGRPQSTDPDQPAEKTLPGNLDDEQFLSDEFARLKNLSSDQRIALGSIIETVLSLAHPLAQQWNTPLLVEIQPGLEELLFDQVTVRNALLTILSVAIARANHTPVLIKITEDQCKLIIAVRCQHGGLLKQPLTEKETATIEAAHRLAEYHGAELSMLQDSDAFIVTLALPLPVQIPVLVIDDNEDWLSLLKRYTAGSDYQVIGSPEPAKAVMLAEKYQPALIFLDVMMPNIDGWQLISDLRNHPTTNDIPIVVCSILPLEGLALSLGINGFLQKPVTQEQFLSQVKLHARKS